MNNNNAIKIENLSKSFKMFMSPAERVKELIHPFGKKYSRDFWALKDINLEISKGSTIGIIGQNGSGKSTLLQIITGILQPTTGSVQVNGRVSALLELGTGFNPEFTGRENVYMNGIIMGLSREDLDNRFDDITAFADIGSFIDQPVKTYSSGMYVRLAFSVAINVDPDILIVDEALSVGDMGFQQKCLHQIELMLDRGITVILVTHDINTVKNYCTNAVYLKEGSLLYYGESEKVTEAYLKDLFAEQQNSIKSKSNIVWKKDHHGKISFGTKHAEICNFSLLCGEKETEVFSLGDPLTVKITAKVDDTITNPKLLIQLRDYRGYPIYGTDTLSAGLAFPVDERKEGFISASFTLDITLAPGGYSLVLSLTDHISDSEVIVHEKIVGALNFTVLESEKIFHGVVDLNARCEKSEIEPERALPEGSAPNDIHEDTLQWAVSHSPSPEILLSLVKKSRKHFGWFTRQLTRAFEYPWILSQIKEFTGRHILDIGAGVSPLPLRLAELGSTVITIDGSSTVRRSDEDPGSWDEWGYLDYSGIDNSIRSVNEDIMVTRFEDNSLDFIYSISVIEHMPASIRRQLWSRITQWLKKEGALLMTVDLVPETEKLWNYCLGKVVEEEEKHGNLKELELELSEAGFKLKELEFLRNISGSRVDCAFLYFKR